MTVRRFLIIALTVAGMLLAILLTQTVSAWRISGHVMRVTQRALEITAAAGELSQLVNEYLVDAHERPLQQWKILLQRSQRIFDTLESNEVAPAEVANFRRDLAQADQLFDVLVKETTASPLAEVLANRRSRIAGQLQLRMRALTNRANRLHGQSYQLQQRMRLNQLVVNISIGCVVVASLLMLYVFFVRLVIEPIEVLHLATARVARGELDPIPVLAASGALSDLTAGFNAMTIQLRESRSRLQDESAFDASENRLRELADVLPHLVWAAQANGRVDYYNRRWEPVLAGRDLTGSSWLNHIHPDDRTSVDLRWAEALRTGRPFDCEFRLGKEGAWRWYSGRIAPLMDASRHIVRWVGTASDMEERKRFEDDLRQSRQRAEVLHRLGLDLVGELAPEHVSDRIVQAAMVLTGAECSIFHLRTPAHKHWQTFGTGAFRERFPDLLKDLDRLPGGSPEPIRIDDFTSIPNGQPWPSPTTLDRSGSMVAVPVASHRGLIRGWLICLHSDRSRFGFADEQLLMGVAALAAIVLDNAEHFAGERRAKRIATARSAELARSNAELEQFAYVASHDLREPLRMISSYLGILEQSYAGVLDERGRRYLGQAVASSQRMQELVHDLLEFSRVGVQPVPVESVDSKVALDTALSHLAQELEASGATVNIDSLPIVQYRLVQLVQVFQNLLGNALKFHADQPVRIDVSAVHDRAFWRFTVCDNGIGINPQHQQRIFVMFQRLHGRGQFEGTGIGLSLCKKIVESHGGQIGVESAPGKGSRFWFTVPDGTRVDGITPAQQLPAIWLPTSPPQDPT